MAIEIGVILPTSTPDPRQPILGDVRAAARLADELNLGSVWATDHLIASAPMLESTVVLATAAAVTDRVGIGFGVMLLSLRPVAWAAKQVATLQYVSGNRVLLGVGTGNPAHGDAGFRAAGVSFADRGRRTDTALGVLPDLIAGRAAMLPDGTEATLAPGAAVPPILVAGNSARARRRAGQFGDGWIVLRSDPTALQAEIAELRQFAAEFGRPAPGVTVIAPSLSTDAARAGAELADYAAAGIERVILAPTGADWELGYRFAADIQARTVLLAISSLVIDRGLGQPRAAQQHLSAGPCTGILKRGRLLPWELPAGCPGGRVVPAAGCAGRAEAGRRWCRNPWNGWWRRWASGARSW